VAHTDTKLDAWMEQSDDPLTGDDLTAVSTLLRELKRWKVRSYGDAACVPALPTISQTIIEAALSRSTVADYLATQVLAADPNRWAIASTLAELARRWQEQRPVGALDTSATVPS